MTEQNNPRKNNQVRFTRRAKVVGAVAAFGALTGGVDFALHQLDKQATAQGESIEGQLHAASHTGSPSPEATKPSPTDVKMDSGIHGELPHGETQNLALVITATEGDVVLRAEPNSHAKKVGVLHTGESEVLIRNLAQTNKDEHNHLYIGGVNENSDTGGFVWVDSSKLPEGAVANYYPQATDAPAAVHAQFDGYQFKSSDVDGPVAAAFGPVPAEQAYSTYVEPYGFVQR